eukprot:Nk52_evm15s278 gene=Nk52_evmTU15s278
MAQLFRQLGGPYVLELVSPAVMAVLSRNGSSTTLNTTQTMSRDRRGQGCLGCILKIFRKNKAKGSKKKKSSKSNQVDAKPDKTVEHLDEMINNAPFKPNAQLEEFLNKLWEHDIVQHGMGLGDRKRVKEAMEDVEQLNFESLSGTAKDMLKLRTELLKMGVTTDTLYALSLTDIDQAAVLHGLLENMNRPSEEEPSEEMNRLPDKGVSELLQQIAQAGDHVSQDIQNTRFVIRPIQNPELAAESPLYSARKAIPSLRDINELLVNAAIVKRAKGDGENEFKDKAMEVLKQVVRVGSKAQNAAATGLFFPENWLDDPPTIEPLQIAPKASGQKVEMVSKIHDIIQTNIEGGAFKKSSNIKLSTTVEEKSDLRQLARNIQEIALQETYSSYFREGLKNGDMSSKILDSSKKVVATNLVKRTYMHFFNNDENVDKMVNAVWQSKDESTGDTVSKVFAKTIKKKSAQDASQYLAEKMYGFIIKDIQTQYESVVKGGDPPKDALQPIALSKEPAKDSAKDGMLSEEAPMALQDFQKIVLEGQMALGKETLSKQMVDSCRTASSMASSSHASFLDSVLQEAQTAMLLKYDTKLNYLLNTPHAALSSPAGEAVNEVYTTIESIMTKKADINSIKNVFSFLNRIQGYSTQADTDKRAADMMTFYSKEVDKQVQNSLTKLRFSSNDLGGQHGSDIPSLQFQAKSFFDPRRGMEPATTPERAIQNAFDEIAEHILIKNDNLPFRVKLSAEANQQMSEKMNDVFGQMTTKVRKATIQQSLELIQAEVMDYIPQPTDEQKSQIADMALVIATFFPDPEAALEFTRTVDESANSGVSLTNPKVRMERSAKAVQIRETVIDSVTEEMNEQVSSILWDYVFQSAGETNIDVIHNTLQGMKTDIEKRSLETINGLLRAHQLSQESEDKLKNMFRQYQQHFKNGNEEEEDAPLLIEDDHSEDILSQISKALNRVFVTEIAENYNAPESSSAREKGSPRLVATEIHRVGDEDGGEFEGEPDSSIRREEMGEDMRSDSEDGTAANDPYGGPDDGQQVVSTEDVR